MKPLSPTYFAAVSGAVLLATPAMGSIALSAGSLAIAFYQVNGSNVVQPNTYVFDMGDASLYRENTQFNNIPLTTINPALGSSNIGADLTAAFGANWASDGTVRWMVVGGIDQSSPVTNGDPARTSYLSRARNDLTIGTTIASISSTNRGILSNNITSFFAGTNNATQTVGSNADGVTIDKAAINSTEDFVPPTQLTYFGIGVDPRQVLGSGTITYLPVGALEGALDIYRVLHTTAGADLTSGYSVENAVAGVGQYIGTLAIDSSGNLSMIPEPSTSAVIGILGSLTCLARRKRLSN